jgi:hypothetical protein
MHPTLPQMAIIKYSGVRSEGSLVSFCSTVVFSCIEIPISKVKAATLVLEMFFRLAQ